MGGSQRPGRDGLLTLQSEMREEGNEVSIAKLCRWFGVPRSTLLLHAGAGAGRDRCGADESDPGVIEANPRLGCGGSPRWCAAG